VRKETTNRARANLCVIAISLCLGLIGAQAGSIGAPEHVSTNK
jgi:hypothetical protein